MKSERKFLNWFLKLGKVKGGLLFFVFLLLLYIVFVLLESAYAAIFDNAVFIDYLTGEVHHPFFLLTAVFASMFFHERTTEDLKKRDQREKAGLTVADEINIKFVRNWQDIRKRGLMRFCFYNGGLIIGMMLSIPVSLLLMQFFVDTNSERLFPEFGDMMAFILKVIIISYLTGTLIYWFRWKFNEGRFHRLTNPLA